MCLTAITGPVSGPSETPRLFTLWAFSDFTMQSPSVENGVKEILQDFDYDAGEREIPGQWGIGFATAGKNGLGNRASRLRDNGWDGRASSSAAVEQNEYIRRSVFGKRLNCCPLQCCRWRSAVAAGASNQHCEMKINRDGASP
ncbi:uncharacterized protein PAC_19937 [Phialocephala subalpina]|uniref:Uncharacterized protein n=1 Tax=Phialocephala subalpina TaxID=576137 RepID=A0A1L7XYK0_9HELO|nr:uncharacterized protein PAC_19937 [Phialocephala subalpina]